ncbi:hypothetical protein MPSEU_000526100 [Mayamaea pseudoterrestris]|nr:hypothetical protein MPSEU_000526100 [Mayamaea pseudoterrestris]
MFPSSSKHPSVLAMHDANTLTNRRLASTKKHRDVSNITKTPATSTRRALGDISNREVTFKARIKPTTTVAKPPATTKRSSTVKATATRPLIFNPPDDSNYIYDAIEVSSGRTWAQQEFQHVDSFDSVTSLDKEGSPIRWDSILHEMNRIQIAQMEEDEASMMREMDAHVKQVFDADGT